MLTNNIVVQFACSLNEDGTFKEYRAVSGSVFSEEYSETLDSATVVLSQVPLKDRLVNIKPYQYVRVYDKSDNTHYDKLFLVDSYNEKENNIEEHLFGYTINLMSETKWLEKIQCPNLSITHDVINGVSKKKTIYQYIQQYMDLFVPKIKFCDGETNVWSYKPLLTYPTSTDSDFYKKFNVPCADMSFSAPTLRQLITNLMLQVGCIPVIKNRVLGYLDFQKNTVDFGNGDYTVNHTVNSIIRSLSSDSYVNNLISVSENVLDSDNEVICETLGFRDRDNVLLKQTENLYLETSLPIYKVNKCILHAPGRTTGYISSNYNCTFIGGLIDANFPVIFYKEVTIKNGKALIKFCLPENANETYVKINKIDFWKRDETTGKYITVATRNVDDFVLNNSTTVAEKIAYNLGGAIDYFNVRSKNIIFDDLPTNASACAFSGTFTQGENERNFSFIRWANNDPNVRYNLAGLSALISIWKYDTEWTDEKEIAYYLIARYNLYWNDNNIDYTISGYQSWDISKLIVENSVRNSLDTDFQKMIKEMEDSTTWTVENLSKYIYGTIGYSIGSTKISGFSSVYSEGVATLAWVTLNYTYIENIVLALIRGGNIPNKEQIDTICNYFDGLDSSFFVLGIGAGDMYAYQNSNLIDYKFEYYDASTGKFEAKATFFSAFFVDLYYQPLNSFNLAYSKSIEDIDIPICQYNSNASGVTDFDRLSLAQQEQVDRIGNETLTISQRTNNVSDIQDFNKGPLLFKDDTNRSGVVDENDEGTKYIIFKRSMAINNNCFNVTYNGSKDAILKNYFTSIRTKYRAYQYIDYSSSVLRKERDTLYVRISKNFYNADDRIWLGNYNNKDISKLKYWLYNFKNDSNKEKILYECEYDYGKIANGLSDYKVEFETVKNSVSLITTNNMIGIIYEYMDNIGAGTYIKDITNNDYLGGITQNWQIWEEDYKEKHTVSFINKIDFYNKTTASITNYNSLNTAIKEIEHTPLVGYFIDLKTSNNVIFNVVDDNSKPVGDYTNVQRTFYKDNAERINHSVQFIYYTDDIDILFDEDFMQGTYMIGRFNNEFNVLYSSKDFAINKYSHEKLDEDTEIAGVQINSGTIKLSNVNLTSTGSDSGLYYGTYQLDITSILSLKDIVIDYKNASYDGGVGLKSEYSIVDNVLHYKVWCPNITMIQESLTISIPYSYRELVSDFYTNYIDIYQEENGIPYIKVTWHNYDIIKMSSKNVDGTVIDIAAFKRPEGKPTSTNYYFTINDTKTDYVLSEKNGIIYRRYKVETTIDPAKNPLELSRGVIKLYEEEDS